LPSLSARINQSRQLRHYLLVSRELGPDRAGATRFVGGMTTRRFNASWPLAELLMTDDVIHVRVRSFVLRRFFARLWRTSLVIPLAEVQRASLVRSPIPGPGGFGLRFDSRTGDWVVFWGRRLTIEELLAACRACGVRIESGARQG
jgi:hypothetical protein